MSYHITINIHRNIIVSYVSNLSPNRLFDELQNLNRWQLNFKVSIRLFSLLGNVLILQTNINCTNPNPD